MARLIAVPRGARCLHWTGAVLAALALFLRLAIPVPPPTVGADTGNLAALFDEHAFCRTASAADGAAPAETPIPQSPPAQHDHDDPSCCLWHAAMGSAVLHSGALQPLVFAETAATVSTAQTSWVPTRLHGPPRTRAPPSENRDRA